MQDKQAAQLICLQALGLLSLVFGKVPVISKAVAFLSNIVVNSWDELWAIGEKNPPSPVKGDFSEAKEGQEEAFQTMILNMGDAVAENYGWVKKVGG